MTSWCIALIAWCARGEKRRLERMMRTVFDVELSRTLDRIHTIIHESRQLTLERAYGGGKNGE